MGWSFDQWVHLLAVLAWPTVAVIVGIAWVRGCRLVLESIDSIASAVIRCLNDNNGRWIRVALQGLARWSSAGQYRSVWPNAETTQMAVTCERALLAVLAARGGFPAKQGEAPGRSLVREVREMYREIVHPTPAPTITDQGPVTAPSMTDLMVSPESLDEYLDIDGGDGWQASVVVDDLYAGMVATDEDTDAEMGDLG